MWYIKLGGREGFTVPARALLKVGPTRYIARLENGAQIEFDAVWDVERMVKV